jgi:uncharacterized protein (DUF1501 family)
MISRRAFLKAGGFTMFGIGLGGIPSFITRAASVDQPVKTYKRNKILVCIFQRGAMDGLMAVTPYTDNYLKDLRPALFMSPAMNKNESSLKDLDGHFGLHPSFHGFHELFKEKRLAIVHGVGSPNTTRSHFDAQDYMESGTPFNKGTNSGWLNRAIGLMGHDASPFRAVSLTSSRPRSFYGDNPSITIKNLEEFALQLKGNTQATSFVADSFEELYDQTSSSLLKETGKESFEAIKIIKEANLKNYKPANNAIYPQSDLGASLRQIAQLIKMNVGLEIGFAESGGWDTHLNQGTDKGVFARNINDLSKSITAFWNDIEIYQDDVVLMTMTEFGRSVKQNGSRGTDHGRGSCSFILGNNVKGGVVHGSIKPLAIDNLEEGRDLPVTTDFRSVFSDIVNTHLGVSNNKIIFPDWKGQSIGILKSA